MAADIIKFFIIAHDEFLLVCGGWREEIWFVGLEKRLLMLLNDNTCEKLQGSRWRAILIAEQ